MVDHGMGQQSSARPSHPGMVIVFGDVEHCGLAGEESQVDSCLLHWRWMAAKDRIILPAPLIQGPARGYGVGSLGRSQQ
jgi:hypothetical protein